MFMISLEFSNVFSCLRQICFSSPNFDLHFFQFLSKLSRKSFWRRKNGKEEQKGEYSCSFSGKHGTYGKLQCRGETIELIYLVNILF